MQRRAFALAAGAAALLLASVGVAGLARLGAAAPVLAQVAAHLAAGREAGIPTGIAVGLGWRASFLAALLLEWTMLLAAFCALDLARERLRAWPWARERLERAEAWARGRERAGVLLLGGVTLMPFLPIGAITSLVVGEALALPALPLLATLMLAELAANLMVALAAASVVSLLPDPALAAGAMALLAVLLGLWLARRRG